MLLSFSSSSRSSRCSSLFSSHLVNATQQIELQPTCLYCFLLYCCCSCCCCSTSLRIYRVRVYVALLMLALLQILLLLLLLLLQLLQLLLLLCASATVASWSDGTASCAGAVQGVAARPQ